MTPHEAHNLLDRVKLGVVHAPKSLINEALIATGDLSRWEPQAFKLEPAREWPFFVKTAEAA